MANVTDPLVGAIHGTDPQNLMEYITRQKIYDCRYWKEECFGLTAADVLEKASHLICYGASFGGNAQPTKFLCLVLKLLQIQPPQELIDSFLEAEGFKYVRVLGAFYKRLTGRPPDIYLALEPLYTEYCKLRYRDISEWKIHTMDQFIHHLLHNDRVCGISLPRLPSRDSLEREGFLDAKYSSPILLTIGCHTLEEYLYIKVLDGSLPAKMLWNARQESRQAMEQERLNRINAIKQAKLGFAQTGELLGGNSVETNTLKHFSVDSNVDHVDYQQRNEIDIRAKRPRMDTKTNDKIMYGSLFKSSDSPPEILQKSTRQAVQGPMEENSGEYWNEQRAKLGLKPLRSKDR